MKRDLYQEVTDRIVAAIEADPGAAKLPWHRGSARRIPVNIVTGNEYRGVNVLNLWIEAQIRRFTSAEWGTYRQWQHKGV